MQGRGVDPCSTQNPEAGLSGMGQGVVGEGGRVAGEAQARPEDRLRPRTAWHPSLSTSAGASGVRRGAQGGCMERGGNRESCIGLARSGRFRSGPTLRGTLCRQCRFVRCAPQRAKARAKRARCTMEPKRAAPRERVAAEIAPPPPAEHTVGSGTCGPGRIAGKHRSEFGRRRAETRRLPKDALSLDGSGSSGGSRGGRQGTRVRLAPNCEAPSPERNPSSSEGCRMGEGRWMDV